MCMCVYGEFVNKEFMCTSTHWKFRRVRLFVWPPSLLLCLSLRCCCCCCALSLLSSSVVVVVVVVVRRFLGAVVNVVVVRRRCASPLPSLCGVCPSLSSVNVVVCHCCCGSSSASSSSSRSSPPYSLSPFYRHRPCILIPVGLLLPMSVPAAFRYTCRNHLMTRSVCSIGNKLHCAEKKTSMNKMSFLL